MKNLISRLWNSESAAIVSFDLIMVMTVVALALGGGLTVIRDAVVTELVDTGQAFSVIDQSFSYPGIQVLCTKNASIAGAGFADKADTCDCTTVVSKTMAQPKDQGEPGKA